MRTAVCVHFLGIEEDQLKCALGHKAGIETFYCFKGCADYKPGKVVDRKDKEKQILDLLSHGGEWSIEEITRITDAKNRKRKE